MNQLTNETHAYTYAGILTDSKIITSLRTKQYIHIEIANDVMLYVTTPTCIDVILAAPLMPL